LFTFKALDNKKDSIGDLKAPGSDGMPSIFYKNCWDLVGNKVTAEVLDVLAGGEIPEGWNDTIIALISNVHNPEQVKDLRSISLCNVLYKVVSKVLANRLKVVLPVIISPSQSAFVPDRLISDNILVAYEILHYMRSKRRGKVGYAVVKLDTSKAYDRVEWLFLSDMMSRMGFSQVWIELIMKCVSTVRYKVKVNGSLTEEIIPEQGLRQGDPLSPHLFLSCAEGFSALLKKAENEGEIGGVKICHGAPSISHLLFADDSLILVRANGEDATKQLQYILDLYAECSVQVINNKASGYPGFVWCSGQVINKDKSAIMFSKNTSAGCKSAVTLQLGINRESFNDKYPGLPIHVGNNKAQIFNYLKERVWQRIQGWKEKLLSNAGKEIMIKAVAQAIPTYAMGCFDITKEICDQISRQICRYWWNQNDKENKMHWLSWEKLKKPKKLGGLGFRDAHAFNIVS
jgi:hypothetical protein